MQNLFLYSPRSSLWNNDLSYASRAVEEAYNDSELVKGVGRVIINRKIIVPEPVIDRPYELLPSDYASRDDRYPLEHMLSSDLTINNHKIFPGKLASLYR